jgi:alpha-beta hydrolase superfamily lysophospholipase
VETKLGRLPCRWEQPEPLKFAYPIVLLPELFTTGQHLAVMLGYLATIGWEVYAPDLRAAAGNGTTPPLGRMQWDDLLGVAGEALDALERPAVVLGHGLGGLLALKLVEVRELKAAVALAPLLPGLRNGLLGGWSRLAASWLGQPLKPPSGRTLFEFLLDVEPFQRPAMVKAMVPDAAAAAREVAAGRVRFGPAKDTAPRLIIAGAADPFVHHRRGPSIPGARSGQGPAPALSRGMEERRRVGRASLPAIGASECDHNGGQGRPPYCTSKSQLSATPNCIGGGASVTLDYGAFT